MPDNVITVDLSRSGNAETRPVWRIDKGMVLKFTGIDLPAIYRVDFSNSVEQEAVPRLGGPDGVSIPDGLFFSGDRIYAWLYLQPESGVGYTKRQILIPLKKRPNVTEVEPTPSEETIIDQAIVALNEAVQQTESNVAHYPKIEGGHWYAWDAANEEWIDTGIRAEGEDGTGIQGVELLQDYKLKIYFTDGTSYTTPASIRGATGATGADGEDGVSPTVSVTDTTGGHRVTITDETGTHTFDVMDGEDGQDGAGVPAGGTAGQILSKRSGTDFDTEWVDSPDFPASLVIVTPPTKVDYEIGDLFDPTGMVVQLVSSKGQIETVEHDALEFTPSVFSEVGLQQVTVTWKEWPYTLYTYQAVSVVEIIPDTWAKIAQVTAAGLAADYFEIADQITDTWGGYTAPWDVVHIDSTGMYLEWHYATTVDIPFDAPEAIYYAPTGGLAAGTYHITIGQTQGTGWVQGNSIQFTLAQAADEGDQFVIANAAEETDPTAGATIKVYGAGSTTVKQSATTSNGTGGTLLGTTSQYVADGNVNATQFVMFGRNDWGQSAYRQYLNVRQPAGSWWTPQNGWDRPPAQAATQNSFAYSVSQELWDVLEPVDVVTATNNATNPLSNSYTTQDRFFLPSLQEMYIDPQLAGVEGVDWDYYKELAQEAGLAGRFQQYQTYAILRKFRLDSPTSAAFVWLRSCYRGARYEWFVNSSGTVGNNNPLAAIRCAPACKLKSLQS